MASRPAAPTPTSSSGSTSLNKPSGSGAEHDPDAYIAQAEEKWNVLIDGDISLLASGLSELVGSFSTEDRPTLAQLSLPLLQNDLVRAAQGLLRTSQDLKLVLLARGAVQRRQLGETPAEGEREDERENLECEVLELKQEIQALLSSGVDEKMVPEKTEEEKKEKKQGKGVEKSDDALGRKEQREGDDASKPTAEETTSSNGGNEADKGEEKEHEEVKEQEKEPEMETDVKEADPTEADTEAKVVLVGLD